MCEIFFNIFLKIQIFTVEITVTPSDDLNRFKFENLEWFKLIANHLVTSKITQSDWFMRTAVKIGWMCWLMMSRGASTHLLVCFLFICFHFNLSLLMTRFLVIDFLFVFPIYNFCLLVYYFCWQVCMFTCLLAYCISFLYVFFFFHVYTCRRLFV